MYRKAERPVNSYDKFELEGRLSEDNRWVIMAKIIPWAEFEEKYAALFSEQMGAPAKTFRMALGSLIIKEKLGTSDIETKDGARNKQILMLEFVTVLKVNLAKVKEDLVWVKS